MAMMVSTVCTHEDRFGNANSAYNFDGVDDNILLPNLDLMHFLLPT